MIKHLIVSGGSTRTISAIGALKFLNEEGLIDDVTHAIGCSAGAILCFMHVLGYDPTEMQEALSRLLLHENRHHLEMDAVFNVLTQFGFDTGKNIVAFLEDMLFEKMQVRDMSFMDLTKKTGKVLVVCVANLTRQETEYFDTHTQPHTSVVQAVRMSVSLPILFTPVWMDDCLYVDGGLYEALPLGYMQRFLDPLKDTVAIQTRSRDASPLDSLGGYLARIVETVLDRAVANRTISPKIKIIDICTEDRGSSPFAVDIENMSFPLNDASIESAVLHGYNVVKTCFSQQTIGDLEGSADLRTPVSPQS
jgi:predicted acylesterase/phospholipase RssA